MCCNPPLKFDYILSDKQKRSPSFVQGRTKSVIHNSRGTTFMRRCLATPTLSSTNILQPGYGGIRQRSTFASSDFFSRLRDFFHSVLTYGLSTNRPFSRRNTQLLLGPSKPLLYSVVTPLANV